MVTLDVAASSLVSLMVGRRGWNSPQVFGDAVGVGRIVALGRFWPSRPSRRVRCVDRCGAAMASCTAMSLVVNSTSADYEAPFCSSPICRRVRTCFVLRVLRCATRFGTISATSWPVRSRSASRCSQRSAGTSNCSVITSNNAGSQHRQWIGAWRRCGLFRFAHIDGRIRRSLGSVCTCECFPDSPPLLEPPCG